MLIIYHTNTHQYLHMNTSNYSLIHFTMPDDTGPLLHLQVLIRFGHFTCFGYDIIAFLSYYILRE